MRKETSEASWNKGETKLKHNWETTVAKYGNNDKRLEHETAQEPEQ